MAIDPKADAPLEVSDHAEYVNLLRSGPIADLAAYLNVDMDRAVQARVEAAVAEAVSANGNTRPAIEVTARPIEPQGNLYGFASIKIGAVTVNDFKIVGNKDGELFVGMPSKPDKTSKTGYRNTVYVDKEYHGDFNAAVIGAYHAAVEQAKSRAANMKAAPDKPRMADQIDKAWLEAMEHNAALPAKARAGKTRGGRGD